MGPHCHGPACLSMEMVVDATNETICKVEPRYGTGDAPMDEAGYAAGIPPCLWGNADEHLPQVDPDVGDRRAKGDATSMPPPAVATRSAKASGAG